MISKTIGEEAAVDAMKTLQQSRERLARIVETVPSGITIVDSQGRITFANAGAEKILGLPRDEITGLCHNSPQWGITGVDGSPFDQEQLPFVRVMQTGETVYGVEHAIVRSDGTRVALSINAAPLRDASGQLAGMVASLTDITERQSEEADRLVAGRLSVLGELASGVAHDFNNVLHGMLGFAELLRSEVTDPRLKRYCDRIMQAASDGSEIVQRMQTFCRARQEARETRAVRVNTLVEEALELTRSRWKNRAEAVGIRIEVQTDLGDLAPVQGSPAELREVFANLILNAIDAMPSGGKLTISTCAMGPQTVAIWVSDTGVGMDAETQERCFDAFFSTKGEAGSGLGLSLVYRTVNQHGGTISVESEPGKGTTFTLFLPVAMERPESPEVCSSAIHGALERAINRPTTNHSLPRPLHLLVIDDEEAVCEILKVGLEQMGHSVETADNGARGLELFRSGEFDAVVTDLGMPVTNGFVVADKVRTHRPGTPVILLTGWGDDFFESDVRQYGIATILSKPVLLNDLAAALRQL